jgi:MFS family permease
MPRLVVSRPKSNHLLFFFAATVCYWLAQYLYMPILAVHSEKNLGASLGLVGAIVGAYGFAQVVLRFPVGVWSDRIGKRKPFIMIGIACAGLGALGMGLTSDPVWMVVWRGLTGVGAASWVCFTVLFASYFPPERVTRALAYVSFVSSASMMVASFVGGIVADQGGWYLPFYLSALLALFGCVAVFPIEEKPSPPKQAVSLGQILSICTVPLLVAVSVITALSTWTIWATVYGFTPLYAAQLGASRGDLGTLATAAQLANAIATIASAFVAERIGVRRTILLAAVTQACGAFMVPFIHSFPLLLVAQILGGGGRALLYPVCMSLSIRAVSPTDRATAMGVFQAVYALGMFAGPATAGYFGDAFGISSVFYIAGAVSVLTVPLILTRVPAK